MFGRYIIFQKSVRMHTVYIVIGKLMQLDSVMVWCCHASCSQNVCERIITMSRV